VIRRVRKLRPSQSVVLFGWDPDVFSSRELGLNWDSEADWHFLAYQDGALVGQLSLLIRTVECGGREVRVSGLGGLITLPHVRGQGVARRLMDASLDFSVKETDAEFILFFCPDTLVPFYQRLGYQEVLAPVVITQPSGPLSCPLHTFYRSLRGAPWEEGTVVIRGLPW
jgi:GNAT superfamily N-acetyltransferase